MSSISEGDKRTARTNRLRVSAEVFLAAKLRALIYIICTLQINDVNERCGALRKKRYRRDVGQTPTPNDT